MMKRSSSDEASSPPRKAAKVKGSPTVKALSKESDSELDLKPSAFDGDQAATGPEAASNLSLPEIGAATGLKRFPDRLYELLNTEAAPDSLYWLPGGKAFAIDQDNFATEVLDKYFQATKFASFIRRLHKWGFRRETRGFRKEIGPELSRSVIAFCHDLFQKESPLLVKQMEEVAKKPQAASAKETKASKQSRKRQSRAESLHSASLEPPRGGSSGATARKRRSSPAESAQPSRDHQIAEQKQDPQQPVPSVAALPGALEASLPTEAATAAAQGEHGIPPILQNIEHQLLLQNLRESAVQNNQDLDSSLRLLLRNQQQSDSLLQRSIITASLAQQQQQIQEQELQQQQRRAALAAAATSNQALRGAAATERLRQQLRRSLAGPAGLSQAQLGLPSPLLAQAEANRLAQQRPREPTSQLMETLLLLELQRQQQQGGQPNHPPNQNRQFPPFG